MDNESTDRLKFDRRLVNRPGWVEPDELAEELGSLPDSADKVLAPDEEPEAAPSRSVPPVTANEAPQTPAFGGEPGGGTPGA